MAESYRHGTYEIQEDGDHAHGCRMLIGSVVVILGIGLFALPAGILAMGFVQVQAKRKEGENGAGLICPYCGQQIGETAGHKREQDEEDEEDERIQMERLRWL